MTPVTQATRRPLQDYIVHGEENGQPIAIPVQATSHSDAQRIAALQPPVTIVHADGPVSR